MFTMEELKAFVEANPKLVTRRESTRYPGLFVLKYTRKVFYDNLWDADGILKECRGLVVNKEYRPVIVPFTKIFNHLENGTDIPLDQKVTVVNKVNGFMAAAAYVEGYGVVVSTTGSLDSPFVDLAKKWLEPSIIPWINYTGATNKTYVFEICDLSDPHIITELPGVSLIGSNHSFFAKMYHLTKTNSSEDDLDYYARGMGAKRPNWSDNLTFGEILKLVKKIKHEGYVVHGESVSLKIKSPYYLVKKLFARKKSEYLSVDWLTSCKHTIEEEYYPLVDKIIEDKEFFSSLEEEDRLKYIERFLSK